LKKLSKKQLRKIIKERDFTISMMDKFIDKQYMAIIKLVRDIEELKNGDSTPDMFSWNEEESKYEYFT